MSGNERRIKRVKFIAPQSGICFLMNLVVPSFKQAKFICKHISV